MTQDTPSEGSARSSAESQPALLGGAVTQLRRKRVPRAASKLKVDINGKTYTASEWNHIGCKIVGCSEKLEKGSRILIELHLFGLNSETKVKCQGEVMWSRNDEFGLKFESLPLYEEGLLTHQLREALMLVGKRKEEFDDNNTPSAEIELENVKTVHKAEVLTANLTSFLSKVASYKGPLLGALILAGLVAAAYYSSLDQVSGRGTVISDVEVVPASENGTLVKLLVSEGAMVQEGTALFVTRDEDLFKEQVARLNQIKKDLEENKKIYAIDSRNRNPGTAAYQSLVAQYKVQLNIYNLHRKLFEAGAVTRESVLEKEKELVRLNGEINIAKSKEQLIDPYQNLYDAARSQFNDQPSTSPGQSLSKIASKVTTIYKTYRSPTKGVVLKLPRLNGSTLLKGSTLAVIQPTNSPPLVRIFLPHDSANRLRIGNEALINIAGIDTEYQGVVASIDKRGGLKMKVTDNQVDDLFDHNSSLQETPAEVLLQITLREHQSIPILSIGSKASVKINANVSQDILTRLRQLISPSK